MEIMKTNNNREDNERILLSSWAGLGIEIWPKEDDQSIWRSIKENARRNRECNIPTLQQVLFVAKVSTMDRA